MADNENKLTIALGAFLFIGLVTALCVQNTTWNKEEAKRAAEQREYEERERNAQCNVVENPDMGYAGIAKCFKCTKDPKDKNFYLVEPVYNKIQIRVHKSRVKMIKEIKNPLELPLESK